jgi:valyl-tRNA synthetase
MLLSSPAGNDLLFDESYCEQGRNFANKVWNAFRLIKGFEIDSSLTQPESSKIAVEWFNNRLSEQLEIINDHYSKYRMSDALMTTYKLVWDDFCAWFLEVIKPEFIDGKAQCIDNDTFNATINFLEQLLKIMHPWMPFITEEIYHLISPKQDELCNKIAAPVKQANTEIVAGGELLKQVISALRDARNKNQLKPKDSITLHIQTANTTTYKAIESILCKQVNATSIAYTNSSIDNTIVVAVEKDKFFIETSIELDATALKATLLADLAYQKGFLESVSKKLSNERFVQNAKPEGVALEQQKQADAIARIATIEESLQSL